VADNLLSPAQFGQKIKAKYPGAYDNVPDEELANKVVSKYPVYHNQIQWGTPASTPQAPQKSSLWDSFKGLVSSAQGMVDKVLSPMDEKGGADYLTRSATDIATGAASAITAPVVHPIQTIKSQGEPFMASGESVGNPYSGTLTMIPFSKTGAAAGVANLKAQQDAQAQQMEQIKQLAAHPAYGFGQLALPALLGHLGFGAGEGELPVAKTIEEQHPTTPAAAHVQAEVKPSLDMLRQQADARKAEALRGVIRPGEKAAPVQAPPVEIAPPVPVEVTSPVPVEPVLRHPVSGNIVEPLDTGGFVEQLPDNKGFVQHNEFPTEVTPEIQKAPEVSPEPLKEPEVVKQEEVPVPKETPQATTPSAPPTALKDIEDRMRPLVGRVFRLNQLVTGNKAVALIQRAKDATFAQGGSIAPEDVVKLSKILKEPVQSFGLTEPQLNKLNDLMGRQLGSTNELQRVKGFAAQSAYMKTQLAESRERMKADFSSTTDPGLKAKLAEKLELDANGKPQPYLYQPRYSMPSPIDLDPTHLEYPFAPKGFSGQIAPLTVENLEAVLGKKPRDLTLGRATPKELEELKNLTSVSASRISKEELQDTMRSGMHIETPDYNKVDQDLRDLKNSIYENAAKKLSGETKAQLQDLTAQWKEQLQGGTSELRGQLDKLPASIKRQLPKELYESEKPVGAPETTTPSGTELPKSVESTRKAQASSASITPAGKKILGKVNDIVEEITTKWPEHQDSIKTVVQGAVERYDDEDSQLKFIHKGLTILHQGLKDNAPDALKKSIDALSRKGESGAIGQNVAPYSPTETQKIAAFTLDTLLKRYEGMTPTELAAYKESFWSEDNRELMDLANDAGLRQRYKKLSDSVPGSNSPSISLANLFASKAEASEAMAIMREASGVRYRTHRIIEKNMNIFDKLMNQLSIPESLRFMDNMEQGKSQVQGVLDTSNARIMKQWHKEYGGSIPDLDDVAFVLRGALDRARNDAQAVTGKFDTYIANYLPHIFNNVGRAQTFAKDWLARSPLEGSTGFLRHREYQFMQDALAAGLQPTTYNPVRLAMMRIDQLDRYTMAHKIQEQFKSTGLAVHYNPGQQPQGWVALDDKIFQPKQYSEDEKGLINRGQYYAPEAVARKFNNFVSQGLQGKWKIPYTSLSLYDSIRNYNNLANQFELSMSLFHATETLLNSAISDGSIGLKQLINQGKIGSAVVRLARTASVVAPIVRHTYYGDHMIAEVDNPGTFLNMSQASRDFELANGRISADPLLVAHSIENLKLNWKLATDNYRGREARIAAGAKLPFNLAGSMIEALAYPLMNMLIPRVKMGTFYDMASQIRDEYAGQSPEVIRQELQKAWDSVDNRYGQVVRENLGMNDAMKDILAVTLRSPGWNIGTVREVGGGAIDLAASVGKAVTGKDRFRITNRTAYALTMIGMTAYLNAMYQHLHPGAPPVEGMDYLYPRNGSKNLNGEWNRVYPKLYTYDFVNLLHNPADTIFHKEAPLMSTMGDMYRNSNYYGRGITDPGDPAAKRIADLSMYMGKQFIPFSISNAQERALRGDTDWQAKIESASGILPAPKWAGQTEAEQLASKYFQTTQSKGPEDEVAFERKQQFVQLRNEFAKGNINEDKLEEALNKGYIKPHQLKYLFDTRNKSLLERYTPQLQFSQVWKVWNAANDGEKEKLLPIVLKKVASEGPEDQEKYIDSIQSYLDSRP